jgi:hypothetical protein
MPLIHRIHKQPLARILALVAMLCAGALQVQEAGHDHWNSVDGSTAQCLVCKAGTAMLPSAAPLSTLPGNGVVDRPQSTQSTFAPVSAPFLARGPPSYS